MSSTISAIVVTYNSAEIIVRCLENLFESFRDLKHEIVVVDNASEDQTCQRAQHCVPGVRLIRERRNRGFASGVNIGVENTSGGLFFILNPDLLLNSQCVMGLRSFMRQNKNTAVVGPELVYASGNRQPSCRRFPTVRAVIASQFRDVVDLTSWGPVKRYLMNDSVTSDPTTVDWLMGACLLVNRVAWEDIGPFDDGFFLYREDTDWCLRAAAKGWRVIYHPEFRAVHLYHRQSARPGSLLLVHARSLLRFYRKHGLRL